MIRLLEYKILREVTDTSDNCHRRREYGNMGEYITHIGKKQCHYHPRSKLYQSQERE